MANTYVDYTAVAAQTDYNFSFEYLRDEHVKVKVNGVETSDFTIVTSPTPTKVRFNTAPSAGAAIKIYRDSRGDFSPLVDFVDGSILTENELDESYKHNLFIGQEASEGQGGEQLTKKGLIDYDAEGNKIINLGTPTTSTDAANKGYVDQTIDNSIALGGSPAIVSLGGYDVTSSNDTLKQLRAWTADIESIADGAVNVTATGSSEARSLATRFADVVNVKDYGATGDGSTDDTTAIQNAINVGGNIFFPSGSYKIGSSLNLASNIKLFGEKGSKIVRDDGGNRIIGKATDYTALTTTADLAKGTTVLSLDSSGYSSLSVGDYIYVTDDTSVTGDFITNEFVPASSSDYHNIDEWIYMTQTFKVLEKLGSNQVRLDSAAIIFFPTTGAGGAFKINQYVDNVSVEDLTFENLSGTFDSTEDAFFNVSHVFDFEVSDCTFDLKGLSGGIYKNFGACSIKNNKFIGAKNLAVFLRQACANSVIQGNSFKNQTTGDASVFLEAHNYNITVNNNNFDGARNTEGIGIISAIQMDARVHNCVIDGNNVNGYGVGVRSELGSTMNVISNNTFQNLDISGLRFVSSTLTTIVGNKFFNTTLTPSALVDQTGAIYINGGKWCNIQNNIIANDSDDEDFALVGTMKYSKFSNNICVNVFSVNLLASSSYNDICNNSIESVSTSSIIQITGSGDSSAVTHYNTIKGNRLYYTGGSSCAFGIRIDSGSECNIIHDNEASNVDYVVGLTSSSNAQSMRHNREQTASATASNNIYNVAISAPVMPSYATMPRRFEIYSTSTGFNNQEQQGEHAWQYVNESGGLNYFRKLSLTSSLVSI